jgi:hypothetical protein
MKSLQLFVASIEREQFFLDQTKHRGLQPTLNLLGGAEEKLTTCADQGVQKRALDPFNQKN